MSVHIEKLSENKYRFTDQKTITNNSSICDDESKFDITYLYAIDFRNEGITITIKNK